MIRNKIYSNKDETTIIRLVAFCEDNDDVAYVTSIIPEIKSYYVKLSDIRMFDEISTEHMLYKASASKPILTKHQMQLARRRYSVISSILPIVEKQTAKINRIKELSALYKVSEDEIMLWLNRYLAFGSIEYLVKSEEEKGCSLKPLLKVLELDKTYKEVGHALLLKIKLVPLGNNTTTYLYLLTDSETHYVYSWHISTEEENYNSIKSLLHSCINNNSGMLPFKISAIACKETWCTFFRNIQMLGCQTTFCHATIEDDLEIKRLCNSLRVFSRGIKNIDALKSRIKMLIKAYNANKNNGTTYEQLTMGLLQALPHNSIRTTDTTLENVLSLPYKTALCCCRN